VIIYLYLTGNAQASFQTQGTGEKFHKKGTGESTGEQQGTGDKVLVKFSEKQGARILLEITLYYFILE
jgi:hypothetical protein